MKKKQDGTKRLDGVLTCTTCHWYIDRWVNGGPSAYCAHPRNVSEVFGSPNGAFSARKPDGCCGPSADLHTSRGIPDGASFVKQ